VIVTVYTEILLMDVDEPAPPLPPDHWIFPLVTHQDLLDECLTKIPDLMMSIRAGVPYLQQTDQSAPTAALKACQVALDGLGGRVILLTSCHPKKGYGKIKCREGKSMYGSEEEFVLYGNLSHTTGRQKGREEKAAMNEYISLREECVRCNICVDVFASAEGDDFKVSAREEKGRGGEGKGSVFGILDAED